MRFADFRLPPAALKMLRPAETGPSLFRQASETFKEKSTMYNRKFEIHRWLCDTHSQWSPEGDEMICETGQCLEDK